MRCGFEPILAPHFAMRFRQNYNCPVRWCGAVRFRVSENYNCIAPYFCGHLCGMVYKMWFEIDIFFRF